MGFSQECLRKYFPARISCLQSVCHGWRSDVVIFPFRCSECGNHKQLFIWFHSLAHSKCENKSQWICQTPYLIYGWCENQTFIWSFSPQLDISHLPFTHLWIRHSFSEEIYCRKIFASQQNYGSKNLTSMCAFAYPKMFGCETWYSVVWSSNVV